MFYSRFSYISRNGYDTLDVYHLFIIVKLDIMPPQTSILEERVNSLV